MTQSQLPDEYAKNTHELALAILKGVLAEIPIVGGIATEFISLLIQETVDKRRNQWIEQLASDLVNLREQIDDFDLEKLKDNPIFVSTLLQAYPIALRNHREEIRQALCNAVLNSSLQQAPEDSLQKMFINWLDRFTVWHVRLLKLFETDEGNIPRINFADRDWVMMNSASNRLATWLETHYVDEKSDLRLYIQAAEDLFSLGAIANLIPTRNMMTQRHSSPKITILGKKFLRFIETPL